MTASVAPTNQPLVSGGDLLLRPSVLVSMVVLMVNDHVLKQRWPGTLTGKLSDVAGLVFFPVVVVALLEVGLRLVRRGSRWPIERLWWVVTIASAVGFTVVKTSPAAAAWYSEALGWMQWPVRGTSAVLQRASVPAQHPILVRADPWDLLALPAVLWALHLTRRATATGPTDQVRATPAGRPGRGRREGSVLRCRRW